VQAKLTLWLLLKGWALYIGVKANVGWLKLFLKIAGEQKKYKHRVGQRVGLLAVPLLYRLCLWSSVKMVYFFLVFSRLFVVVESFFTLASNVAGLA
jgi:hypothetical protein